MAKAGTGKTRLVTADVSDKVLKKDLERYRKQAIEMGAADAKVIPADMVMVDERVRLKCWIGRCYNYGQSANCPPHTPEPDFMRHAFRSYQWAIVFRQDIQPSTDFSLIEKAGKEEGERHNRQNLDIASTIESLAFRDGYYLAAGFGSGSCKGSLCAGQYCQALDSRRCRFPLRARPSMEAVGIDVFGLAAKVGWQMYPVYRSIDPEAVPCANTVGLVFIH